MPARPSESVIGLNRIRAAAEASSALPIQFTLTARADQYMWGRPNLAEVIRRVQAFQEAGANAVMVPGLSDPSALRTLCNAVDVPVVVLVGAGPGRPERRALAASGVKRIGIGGAMVRVALSAFVNAAQDLIKGRELDWLADAIPGRKLTEMFQRPASGRT